MGWACARETERYWMSGDCNVRGLFKEVAVLRGPQRQFPVEGRALQREETEV